MNAGEETEIKLQRVSATLIADTERLLPLLLFRHGSPIEGIRQRVNRSNVERIVKLVGCFLNEFYAFSLTVCLFNQIDPFQEWPQLLDPHLANSMSLMVSAFRSCLSEDDEVYYSIDTQHGAKYVSLSQGISRIVYVLCKVRGQKVISRLLGSEPHYLALILDKFTRWQDSAYTFHGARPAGHSHMVWEERYSMLLWLSHLMMTPFDLESISPDISDASDCASEMPPGLPEKLPLIVSRLMLTAFGHLQSPSRERDAASLLLTRLTLRPDMQRYKLVTVIVDWAIDSLSFKQNTSTSIYHYAGLLSVLAGVVSTGDVKAIRSSLSSIYRCADAISQGRSPCYKAITSSALSRKVIVKILRSLAILSLQHDLSADLREDALESIISYLLESLADTDTLVRFASSKALGMIAAAMEPAMAGDVVEAVLGNLEEDVFWSDLAAEKSISNHDLETYASAILTPNLASVNALRWHGLTLTLAQLLFRRSALPEHLPKVISALLLALDFEQRKSTGTSIGGNVRDAACFGVWSIARKYTTEQLSAIDPIEIRAAETTPQKTTVLQIMANHMMIAATVDPSGNIRRGASAALQELIGRHPDTISEGISVVQVVDYHAVALRSNAVIEVTQAAATFDSQYLGCLIEGLLGWKGIGSPDAPSRRLAASAIGLLVAKAGESQLQSTVRLVVSRLKSQSSQKVEQKHGLLISMASILRHIGQSSRPEKGLSPKDRGWMLLTDGVSKKDLTLSSMKPHLTAEAVCELIQVLCQSSENGRSIRKHEPSFPCQKILEVLQLCLYRPEEIVVQSASKAAYTFFKVISLAKRQEIVANWSANLMNAVNVKSKVPSKPFGTLVALAAVFPLIKGDATPDTACETQRTIISTMVIHTQAPSPIEVRITAIQSLTTGPIRHYVLETSLISALITALGDYTIDSRGDIGSLVRIEAIQAVDLLLEKHGSDFDDETRKTLVGKIVGLAVEKLDKVRTQAAKCLWNHGILGYKHSLEEKPPSVETEAYFMEVLKMLRERPRICEDLLKGLVTTLSSGSESVLRASRAALAGFIEHSSLKTETIQLADTLINIITISHATRNERLLVPALESLAFLFETKALDHCFTAAPSPSPHPPFSSEKPTSSHLKTPKNIHSVVPILQKTHSKSQNTKKIAAAIICYKCLANMRSTNPTTQSIQKAAYESLLSLLMHPFPQIRQAAAEAVYLAIAPIAEGTPLKENSMRMTMDSEYERRNNVIERQQITTATEVLRRIGSVDWGSHSEQDIEALKQEVMSLKEIMARGAMV